MKILFLSKFTMDLIKSTFSDADVDISRFFQYSTKPHLYTKSNLRATDSCTEDGLWTQKSTNLVGGQISLVATHSFVERPISRTNNTQFGENSRTNCTTYTLVKSPCLSSKVGGHLFVQRCLYSLAAAILLPLNKHKFSVPRVFFLLLSQLLLCVCSCSLPLSLSFSVYVFFSLSLSVCVMLFISYFLCTYLCTFYIYIKI